LAIAVWAGDPAFTEADRPRPAAHADHIKNVQTALEEPARKGRQDDRRETDHPA
jgi:hypothetical protein